MNDFAGVILAAGRGTRMFPFTTRWPKPILPILGKPLLQHQIEMMKSVGIDQVLIVIGYLGYEIVRTLGNGDQMGVRIEYIEQTETLGIAHAVGRLEGKVRKPFLLCLGDIFFVSDRLQTMFDLFGQNHTRAVLASKIEERPEMIVRNFAIIPAEDGTIKRVIEKPGYVQNKLKGCGIYLFGLEIFDAIRRTPRTALRDEYEITESIQILINDGHRVVHAEIIDEDLNLTTPEDLLYINMEELNRQKLANLCLTPQADLSGVRSCVLGRDVVLEPSVSLESCILFDEVKVHSGTKLSKAILTPEGVIQCRA